MRPTLRLLGLLTGTLLVAGCSDDKDGDPIVPPVDESVTASITRGSSGELRNDEGVELLISPGTVGKTIHGQPGRLLFSIEPIEAIGLAPEGFEIQGQAWQFGPEGTRFGQRSRIALPVLDTSDTSKAHILGRLNRSNAKWEMVPSLRVAGKPGLLCADVKHFSTWSVFSFHRTDPRAPGRIHFRNDDPTRWLSLCVRSYTLASPEWEDVFDPSGVGAALSAVGHIPGVTSDASVIVPQGTWTFQATRTDTVGGTWTAEPDGWITLDPITVDTPGDQGPHVFVNPSGWTEVNTDPPWAPCEGEPDIVLGTGAVQITLTWDDPVDLDLHVIEPSGEKIYFGHRNSETGGHLLRDTICENTDEGNPENIFWDDSAPIGTYEVRVHLYSLCGSDLSSVSFRVRRAVDGKVRTYTGSVTTDETAVATIFTR
jgi:hypothetical protein